MEYQIKLEFFQGPLDLLLHLIEKEEVDIYNIPIAFILEKYLEYIHTIQLLNLDGVGDFLVMAATLMQIKAKLLLPQTWDDDETEVDEEADPRWELAKKLIEYKKIKEAAICLQSMETDQLQVYTRVGGEFPDQHYAAADDSLKELSIWELVDSFKVIIDTLERKHLKSAIPKPQISVKQRMTEIFDLVTLEGKVYFKAVFNNVDTKIELITCFLAVLELIRLHKINVFQEASFGEIILLISEKVCTSA